MMMVDDDEDDDGCSIHVGYFFENSLLDDPPSFPFYVLLTNYDISQLDDLRATADRKEKEGLHFPCNVGLIH